MLEALRRCLLTDYEMKRGPVAWANTLKDPFPEWTRSEEAQVALES
jgi:hypothetical protein